MNRQIKEVESALGFKLKDWQVDYIWKCSEIPARITVCRANGKTLAHILRTLLMCEEPLDVSYMCDDWEHDMNVHSAYRRWYVSELISTRDKLIAGNVKGVREIVGDRRQDHTVEY